jgi:hypothetical protein
LTDIGSSIALTCLTRRRSEAGEFPVGAADRLIVDDHTNHRFEQVMEGCEPVHPAAPEIGETLGWDQNAAEADNEEEE